MTNTNWRTDIVNYLFDTNLRWSMLHTSALQRFIFSVKNAREYKETYEKTVKLIDSALKYQKAELLEKIEKLKEPEPVAFELSKLRNETIDDCLEIIKGI